MTTSEVLEHWSQWAWHKGAEAHQAILVAEIDNLIFEEMDRVGMRELVTAIALTGAFQWEMQLRVHGRQPIVDRATFLKCAAIVFLTPMNMCRAVQAGVQFSPPPQDVQISGPVSNWSQESGGLGGDHGVGRGAQNVYPFLRKPK